MQAVYTSPCCTIQASPHLCPIMGSAAHQSHRTRMNGENWIREIISNSELWYWPRLSHDIKGSILFFSNFFSAPSYCIGALFSLEWVTLALVYLFYNFFFAPPSKSSHCNCELCDNQHGGSLAASDHQCHPVLSWNTRLGKYYDALCTFPSSVRVFCSVMTCKD